MISTEVRRSQVYVGTGDVSEYSFPFRVFDKTQVAVRYKASNDAAEVVLDKSKYSVSLQDDALQSAGGSITLNTPLAKGAKLTVLSAIPYTQTLNLRNQGAFNANDLNTAWDKNCALIQQVLELTERAVTVDATDTMTPAELKKALLETAVNAKDYAQKAEKTYNEVIKTQEQIEKVNDNVNEKSDHVDAVKKDIDETADNVKKDITDTAASIKKDIDETAGGIKDLIDNNKESFDAVSTLAPHVDDLTAISGHINEVHKVGQDLMGVNANSLDLGYVTGDPDTITKVIDGYIKKVAEHIDDCVHPVAMSLDSVKAVAKNLEPVNQVVEIMHVDYESIFLNGLSEGD